MPPAKKPTEIPYVRCRETFGVLFDGEQVTVHEGEFLPKGHPITKGREWAFEPVVSLGRWDTPPKPPEAGRTPETQPEEGSEADAEVAPTPAAEEPPIEEATAAPGRKRNR